MRKVLEDLYFGNIEPYSKRIAPNSELQHLMKRAADCESQLAEQLNESGQKILDRLISVHHEINSITALEYFIMGFRLGARLIMECINENDDDLTDGGK